MSGGSVVFRGELAVVPVFLNRNFDRTSFAKVSCSLALPRTESPLQLEAQDQICRMDCAPLRRVQARTTLSYVSSQDFCLLLSGAM